MQSVSRNLGDNYQPDRPPNDYRQRFVYRVRCQAVRMENGNYSGSSCSVCGIACRLKSSLLHLVLAFVVQFRWVELCIAQEPTGIDAILRGDLSELNVALQCFRDPISSFSGMSDLQFVFVNSYYRVTNLTRDTRRYELRRQGLDSQLRMDHGVLPCLIQCKDGIEFRRNTESRWEFRKAPEWYFRLDEKKRDNCTVPEGVKPGDPQVLIDLKGFVGRLVEGNESAFQFDRVTGTWWALYEAKGIFIELRFRTPSDSRVLGHSLAEIITFRPTTDPEKIPSVLLDVRGIICGTDSPYQIQFADSSFLTEKLDAILVQRPCPLRMPKTNADDEAANQMHALLTESFGDPTVKTNLGFLTTATLLVNRDGDGVTGTPDRQRVLEILPKFIANLRLLRRYMIAKYVDKHQIPIDDPAIWGELTLRSLDGSSFSTLHEYTALLLQNKTPTKEELGLLLDYMDALADLGSPSFAPIFRAIENMQKPDLTTILFDAIHRSRWQRPCDERHVLVCLGALESPDFQSEAAIKVCVETLIRLDKCNEVPVSALKKWWKNEVVAAEIPTQWDGLNIISRQPSGRAWLLRELEDLDSASTLAVPIRHILSERAKTTQEFQRWDFMTSAECEDILARVK